MQTISTDIQPTGYFCSTFDSYVLFKPPKNLLLLPNWYSFLNIYLQLSLYHGFKTADADELS